MLHGWINQWRWRGDYEGGFSLGLWFSLLCWESFTELGLVGSSRPSWCEHTGRCPPLPPPVRQGWLPLVCIYQDNMTLFLWLLWSCLSFWLGWEMLGNFTHTHLSFFFFQNIHLSKLRLFTKLCVLVFTRKHPSAPGAGCLVKPEANRSASPLAVILFGMLAIQVYCGTHALYCFQSCVSNQVS